MKNNYAITINPVQQCMNTIKQSYKAQLEDFDFEHSYNHVEHLSQWERPALRNFNTKVEIVEQYFNIKNYKINKPFQNNPNYIYYSTNNNDFSNGFETISIKVKNNSNNFIKNIIKTFKENFKK